MFHPDAIGGIIAVFVIIGVFARSIVKVVMDADVRKIEARRAIQAQDSSVSASQIETLLAEIAQLRETTTQHALSLQHSVERLDHRVEFMERKSIAAADLPSAGPEPVVDTPAPQQQSVGHR